MKDKEAQLIWETLQLGKGGSDDKVCPKCGKVHPINASCGKVHEDNSLDAWNTKMQGEEGFQIGDFVDIDDPDDEYASQAEWVVVQVEGDEVTVAKVDENDVRTLPAQNVTKTGGGSTSQVSSMLDAAAGGDFMSYLNKIEFDDRGAAALVEWLARYNLGAS